MKRYEHLILGGTFDHFHRGHRVFVNEALKRAKKITIGIVKRNLYENKLFASAIEEYEVRKSNVRNYLNTKNTIQNIQIIPIADIYGTSLSDITIDAILVTDNTYGNALLINSERKKKDLPPLMIVKIPEVTGDDGKIITSERIRMGEVDREGNNFQFSIFNFQKKALLLPKYLRNELRKPLGKIIKGSEKELEKTAQEVIQHISQSEPLLVISVGDIVTMSLLEVGYTPDVQIIDFRSRRKEIRVVHPKGVSNKSGTISKEAFEAIHNAIHPKGVLGTRTIIIDGEEDLLVLPAVLLAPLKSIVIYGQMDFGVVVVEVTESVKQIVRKIVSQFV